MKFLDERIIFDVLISNLLDNLPNSGVYTYVLMAADNDSYAEEHEVFVGNFYYNRPTFVQTLDVTDIIRNARYNYRNLINALHNPDRDDAENYGGHQITEYWIKLRMVKDGSPLIVTSSHLLVANVYRYPNRSIYANLSGGAEFLNYNLSAFSNSYKPLLMGYKYSRYSQGNYDNFLLMPRYPCIATQNYAHSVTFGYGSSVSSIELYMSDLSGDYDDNKTIYILATSDPYNSIWVSSLGELLSDYMYEVEEHGASYTDLDLYYIDSNNNYIQIGVFETCYSRYYLQWMDRFGFIQSQPFKENITYSEDIETEEIKTYTDVRRLNNISILPKWKLYSGWIKDEVYPIYESIFASPFLILYDTATNMNYEVIVKGNYIEKNYKNQKSLVNLELNLEAAEKQNITY